MVVLKSIPKQSQRAGVNIEYLYLTLIFCSTLLVQTAVAWGQARNCIDPRVHFTTQFNTTQQRQILDQIRQACARHSSPRDCAVEAFNRFIEEHLAKKSAQEAAPARNAPRPPATSRMARAASTETSQQPQELFAIAREEEEKFDTIISSPSSKSGPSSTSLRAATETDFKPIDDNLLSKFEAKWNPKTGQFHNNLSKPADVSSGRAIDSTNTLGTQSESAIWAVTSDGKRYVVTDPRLGNISLGSISAKRDVVSGGEIDIVNGRVMRITNRSEPHIKNSVKGLQDQVSEIKAAYRDVREVRYVERVQNDGTKRRFKQVVNPLVRERVVIKHTPEGKFDHVEVFFDYDYRILSEEVVY